MSVPSEKNLLGQVEANLASLPPFFPSLATFEALVSFKSELFMSAQRYQIGPFQVASRVGQGGGFVQSVSGRGNPLVQTVLAGG